MKRTFNREQFRWLMLAVFLVAVSHPAQAVTFPDKPPTQNFFVDQAQLIKEADRKTINDTSQALLKQEQIPLFVVTINSLSEHEASGLGIEGYAKELFNHWEIGTPA